MTDEIKRKIAEVKNAKNFENIDQVDDAGKALKELVYLLDELPQPVQSPSEWIVEVDGEVKGDLAEWSGPNDRYVVCYPSEPDGSPDFSFIHVDSKRTKHPHIRLLTKEGGCVMDNKLNPKNEDL